MSESNPDKRLPFKSLNDTWNYIAIDGEDNILAVKTIVLAVEPAMKDGKQVIGGDGYPAYAYTTHTISKMISKKEFDAIKKSVFGLD